MTADDKTEIKDLADFVCDHMESIKKHLTPVSAETLCAEVMMAECRLDQLRRAIFEKASTA